jgi:two-component system, chemotaxis family, chemotaxis protein CheY
MNKVKIMLIDDDDIFLSLTRFYLEQSNIVEELYSFSCGIEAQKYLESCDKKNDSFPDFIFVDINMPGMDGFEFVDLFDKKFARRFPQTNLMMLTSSISKREKTKGMQSPSVKGFLEKPLTENMLEKIVNEFVNI